MSTLRNKIAQMLLMGFSGTHITPQNPASRWIKDEGIGGVILFNSELNAAHLPKNIIDKTQIKQLNDSLQDLAAQHVNPHPLFIAVDYEGGEVDRLNKVPGCPATLKPVEMAKLTPDAMSAQFTLMAQTLKSLGFNLDFAPVVDLAFDVEEGIIGKRGRSFSQSPQEVTEIAQRFVNIFRTQGIWSCYKHFPGHGSAKGDTHLGFVDVTQTYDRAELEPYRHLKHVDMIMTAHVVNHHLDPSGLPATLSKRILTHLLREELGFKGIIISDDMQMRAIAACYPLKEALTLTINAGADMMIFGNQWGTHDASMLIDEIEQLVFDGAIDQTRIEDAYNNITRLKINRV